MKSGIDQADVDPDVRPQDDLFGHVNGRWLATTEIPERPRPLGLLRRAARDAPRRTCARSSRRSPPAPPSRAPDAAKIGDLYASFMDEDARRGARRRARSPPTSPRSRRSTDAGDARRAASARSAAPGCSALRHPVRRHRRPRLRAATSSTSSRAASACPTSPTTARTSSPRSARPTSPTSSGCCRLAGWPDAAGAAGARDGPRDPARRRPLGQGDQPRPVKTYNLDDLAELRRARPRLRLGAWLSGARRRPAGASPRSSCASPTSSRSMAAALGRGARSTTGRPGWRWHVVHAQRAATCPPPSSRRTSTSTAAPSTGTPEMRERWKRGVALVEGALGEAVGQLYVARHFPPDAKAQMDELVANLVEAYRRSIVAARLDERRRPGSGRSTSSTSSAPRSATRTKWRDYSRARDRAATTCSATCAAASAFETDRELAQDRRAGRPRRVVHDPADRQRLLQPRHQRDRASRPRSCSRRSSTPTPTPPSTTAASAR